MKYKEFKAWCNDRACDGCWSSATAVYCINVINHIDSLPFWKREKQWRLVCGLDNTIENVVNPINEKMIEMYK